MKNLKSVLAVLAALCLMLCLTVPVFATEELATTSASVSAEAFSTEATTAGTETVEDDFAGAQPGAEQEEGDLTVDLTGTAPVEGEGEDGHTHVDEEETSGHKALRIVLTVLEVIASLALIIIVLVQSGKESGLSGAIAGNSDSYMGKGNRATLDKKLATMTKWVALVWVALTLALSLI